MSQRKTTHKVVGRLSTHDFGSDVTSVEIRNITDLHVGEKEADTEQFEEDLAWSLESPHRYLLFGGDLFDNATRNSVGDIFDTTMNPREQRNYLLKTLKPYAEAGKILGMVGGNHEHRTAKDAGEDLTEALAIMLAVPYFEDEAFFNIRFGKNKVDGKKISYIIYLAHGSSGGTTAGGKVNAARKGSNVVHADVYLSGHTHGELAYVDSMLMPDPRRGTVSQVNRLFVACGTYCGRSRYAKRNQYTPSIIGSPIVHLDGCKKRATTTIG